MRMFKKRPRATARPLFMISRTAAIRSFVDQPVSVVALSALAETLGCPEADCGRGSACKSGARAGLTPSSSRTTGSANSRSFPARLGSILFGSLEIFMPLFKAPSG